MSAGDPKRVGPYRVEGRLGEGGMGVIHAGRHELLERRVALKQLRRELVDDGEQVARFLREARAAATVRHDNVVTVYDCLKQRGTFFIASELVEGPDLGALLARTGPLDEELALILAHEILRGLAAIHEVGVVHRDLKPANVLVSPAGEVKIADFGIALEPAGEAITRTGVVLGTPPYIAPEQIEGERADARSDLFALGVLLYELLSGRPPFVGPEADDEPLLARIRRGRFEPLTRRRPGTSRATSRLVSRCLAARPERRPKRAAELAERLAARLGDPSSDEVRRELAASLWKLGAFEESGGKTRVRSRAAGRSARSRRWPRVAGRRAMSFSLGLLALLVGGVPWVPLGALLAPPAESRSAASLPRASSRLVVAPAAGLSLRVDGGSLRPLDAGAQLELPPGAHRVALVGPLGIVVEEDLWLWPGQSAELEPPGSAR